MGANHPETSLNFAPDSGSHEANSVSAQPRMINLHSFDNERVALRCDVAKHTSVIANSPLEKLVSEQLDPFTLFSLADVFGKFRQTLVRRDRCALHS